ncbi:hypothetical protein K437DRAFT_268780 [Tilletiaria anomala UBC 951]|uniref:Uncharacterized protein n=1 Tax=Tilletiaria anomala (strain ATCC 24038 / CBS 436.72 / UBC 951) TaxID=1037660 RepID=A0A066VS26_TILAU|nr:uncharacterized protein K437DRAFT_268780 [Tilletiaria anomala UBC 951]KDN44532.1 hypothetical protein K437DRAFT_268780 [Tilletiaria anomala UBC 951]
MAVQMFRPPDSPRACDFADAGRSNAIGPGCINEDVVRSAAARAGRDVASDLVAAGVTHSEASWGSSSDSGPSSSDSIKTAPLLASVRFFAPMMHRSTKQFVCMARIPAGPPDANAATQKLVELPFSISLKHNPKAVENAETAKPAAVYGKRL